MVAQAPPFSSAVVNRDPFYRAISQGKAKAFWRAHEKHKPAGYFSNEFKDLVISMLQLEPTHRPSISELLYHPWMQQEVASAEDIKKEFDHRNVIVTEEREKEREQRQQLRNKIVDGDPDKANRANDPPARNIDVYAEEKLGKHSFKTKMCPDIVEEQLLAYLNPSKDADKPEPFQSKENYLIKFSLGKQCKPKPAEETLTQTDNELDDELEEALESLGQVQMMMRITKLPAKTEEKKGEKEEAEESTYAVELLSDDIDQFRFNKAANELKKNCLNFAIEQD